ncbi:MAG: Gfo/Idh/MocA family oxidoreductase [Anaerolineales bacterium]|nr:Gfo/Idh/MocA family oxidoreductase [Anaerolineales bacterium]
MNKIRTAIIGCGKVGQIHAEALSRIPESEFVAVCSRQIDRAQLMAQEHGAKAYTDVATMVRDSDVQAVVVCTPHPVHAEPAIAAIQAGANVLVEKPLASTLEDCDAMINAANDAGVKLGVISQRRLYPPVRRVREAIDSGKIDVPVLGMVIMLGWRDEKYYSSDAWRGKWKAEGGGVLVNQSPHQLDILQWLMGPIDEVFGYWDNLNHPYIEVEDTAIAAIRFKNGGLGSIVVSNSQKPGLYGKVHIYGKNGASVGVQTDGGAMFIAGMTTVVEPPINDLWTVPGEEELLEKWQKEDRETFSKLDTTTHYLQLQDQDFLQAIIKDRDPMVTGVEGRKTVELFTAIYRSQRNRQPVKFPLSPEFNPANMDGRLVKGG